VEEGQELAGVEMTPLALVAMVIDREFEVALGTTEEGPSRVFGPHVDPATFSGELDSAHHPGCLKSQDLLIQLGIAHAPILPPRGRSGPGAPTEKPEAPKLFA
jgi:hypothetical protein